MASLEMNDLKKIGLGLTGFDVFFTILGAIFVFDKGLIAMGNILFLAGVTLTIGINPAVQFFTKRRNFKNHMGSLCSSVFLQRIPLLGWLLHQPCIRSLLDHYCGRRVPV